MVCTRRTQRLGAAMDVDNIDSSSNPLPSTTAAQVIETSSTTTENIGLDRGGVEFNHETEDVVVPTITQSGDKGDLDGLLPSVTEQTQPPKIFDQMEEVEIGENPPSSPAPTEIAPEPPQEVVPFESTLQRGVTVRDYAFDPHPIRPPPFIFPILTTYIWFLYNRHRFIKRKPRILLNNEKTAFLGRDLVYLIHFNWIAMDQISWLDARDSLGQGLIYLYEHPSDVEISYGARRPSPKSPQVTKWFSKFKDSPTLEFKGRKRVKQNRLEEHERAELNVHGPFGEAIYRYFSIEESVVYWPLYEYLIGKGPRPMMSELMERVFAPILNCHGGGVGGFGVPYERPRANDYTGNLEGTEPQEVDIDPDLVTIERAKVPAFIILRQERTMAQEEEMLRRLEEENAEAVKARRRKRGNGWSRKKSHKPPVVNAVPKKEEEEDEWPTRRLTRSAAAARAAAKAAGEKNVSQPRTSVRKGKTLSLPGSDDQMTALKRERDDEDAEIEYEDPGSSNWEGRHACRNGEAGSASLTPVQESHSTHELDSTHENGDRYHESENSPRGTKRKRSLAPEPSDGAIDAFRKRRQLAKTESAFRIATPPPPPIEEPDL